MNFFKKTYYLFIWAVLAAPSVVNAWSPTSEGIVPDCAKVGYKDPTGGVGCHFDDLIILIGNIMDFFIWISIPIATLLFAWIGWTFIVEGDKSSARSDAKKKLMALVKGLALILSAWLIVKLVLVTLVKPEFLPTDLIKGLKK